MRVTILRVGQCKGEFTAGGNHASFGAPEDWEAKGEPARHGAKIVIKVLYVASVYRWEPLWIIYSMA